MSEEKVLTKEIAAQFLKEEDSVDLSVYSEFEDSAIEALSNYDGQLALDTLVKETKEWEYLGPFNCGVREKGEALACLLSKHKGDLEFDMLLELSEEEARALANHRGSLSFGSLKSITKTTETILSEKRSQEKLKYPKYLLIIDENAPRLFYECVFKEWRVLYGEHELTYRVRDDGDGLDTYVFVNSNWVADTQKRSLANGEFHDLWEWLGELHSYDLIH